MRLAIKSAFILSESVLLLIKYVFFFSPSGKLAQIEYAVGAVVKGGPSVGAKGMLFSFSFAGLCYNILI